MSGTIKEPLPNASPPRVLAVDDESYVRDIVSRWLNSAGLPCAQAENAKAAWDYLASNEVDLAVMDINMPGSSGLELLGQVRKQYPDTAVLMMTAMNDTKTAIQALTNGAWGYLVKPVEREELIFQARGALERRQLIVERREYTHSLEEKVRQATQAVRSAHEETIHRLAAASLCRDEETGMHIRRTGLLSEVLAKAVGWSAADAELIRMAAPMHDVGKIGIPDAILRKPGQLTPAEYEIMKTHTTIGAKMLAGSQSAILELAGKIAMNHHEHWDGSGYPRGLSGPAIPEAARIVTIVDVYDALSHDRVYRKALPEEEVLDYMRREAGSLFDPLLLAAFFSCFDEIRQITLEHWDKAVESESNVVAPLDSNVLVTSAPAWASVSCDSTTSDSPQPV